jgi:hypothetical protein
MVGRSSAKSRCVIYKKTFHRDLRSLSVAIGHESPRYFSHYSGVPGDRVSALRDRTCSAAQIATKLH